MVASRRTPAEVTVWASVGVGAPVSAPVATPGDGEACPHALTTSTAPTASAARRRAGRADRRGAGGSNDVMMGRQPRGADRCSPSRRPALAASGLKVTEDHVRAALPRPCPAYVWLWSAVQARPGAPMA